MVKNNTRNGCIHLPILEIIFLQHKITIFFHPQVLTFSLGQRMIQQTDNKLRVHLTITSPISKTKQFFFSTVLGILPRIPDTTATHLLLLRVPPRHPLPLHHLGLMAGCGRWGWGGGRGLLRLTALCGLAGGFAGAVARLEVGLDLGHLRRKRRDWQAGGCRKAAGTHQRDMPPKGGRPTDPATHPPEKTRREKKLEIFFLCRGRQNKNTSFFFIRPTQPF